VGKNLKGKIRIPAAIAMVLVSMLLPAACGSSAAATNTVEMHNLQYSPAFLTVSVGTTVTWKNTEVNPHSVTSDIGLFDSGLFSPGDSYTYKFNTAGTYHYSCAVQPGMTGTICVK
jgi:plastocyanin